MSSIGRTLLFAAAIAVGWLMAVTELRAEAGVRLEATAGQFRLRLADGRILERGELVGTTITLSSVGGTQLELRIDWARPDADDPEDEIMLYGLSRREPQSGDWVPLCRPGPDGIAAGLPLTRTRSADDGRFSIACTAGAQAKCARLGYKPWARSEAGEPLEAYFEACVRMLRADYCGDGRSHTRDGKRVRVWDRLGRRGSAPSLPIEAAWGPHGAVCVSTARAPEVSTLAEIVRSCPAILTRLRPSCGGAHDPETGDALLWNASQATQ